MKLKEKISKLQSFLNSKKDLKNSTQVSKLCGGFEIAQISDESVYLSDGEDNLIVVCWEINSKDFLENFEVYKD